MDPPVDLPPLTFNKSALRDTMRARLRAVSPDERRERSARLVARLVEREDWQRAQVVGLFAPLSSEPDVDLLWTLPGALTEKTIVYPRVHPGGLRLHVVACREDLRTTTGQLREPSVDAPALAAWPDLLLVPGLAFTIGGGRLGRGGGYYDRLLAQSSPTGCLALGVGFHFQVVGRLPLERHDVPLNYILTDGWVV